VNGLPAGIRIASRSDGIIAGVLRQAVSPIIELAIKTSSITTMNDFGIVSFGLVILSLRIVGAHKAAFDDPANKIKDGQDFPHQ